MTKKEKLKLLLDEIMVADAHESARKAKEVYQTILDWQTERKEQKKREAQDSHQCQLPLNY